MRKGRSIQSTGAVERKGDRLVIRDTFTNKTDDVLGIILKNRVLF